MNAVAIELRRAGWSSHAGVWARGDPVLDGGPATAADVARALSSGQPLPRLVRRLGGSFALVVRDGPTVHAVVDRVRSIPLYYATDRARSLVSDDPYWIRDQLAPEDDDAEVRAEFLLTGYVTGADTLAPSVKQVRAGEMVVLAPVDGRARLAAERWFVFWPVTRDVPADLDRLVDSWDAVLGRVLSRVAGSARDRTLVVPLSGGGDSRTIAAGLREAGHPDVRCFTYGGADSAEVRRARDVAQRLGLPWTWVPYDRARWARWSLTSEWHAYPRFADGLSSLEHRQDWPAVWELRKSGTLPPDAIFVPGHALDFLGGSHLPVRRSNPGADRAALETEIWHHHYRLWRGTPGERALARARLRRSLVELPAEGADDVRSSLESWNWQERQAKFIANAVRVYEFWGYEWRLPFWDAEVVDFWAAVPPALRHRSMLLRSALKRQAARLGLPEPLEPPAATLRGAARLMAPTATDIAARMIRRARRRHEYFEHPMGWYGAVPWPVFRELYTGAEDVASFVARERAGRRA